MKQSKMIRAWRNQDVDAAATDASATVNPAGVSDLDEKLLGSIGGATSNACGGGGGPGTWNGGPGTFCRACHR